MKNKNKILITVSLVLAAYFIWGGLLSMKMEKASDVTVQETAEAQVKPEPSIQKSKLDEGGHQTPDELSDHERVVEMIQGKFSGSIYHRHTQVKALEKLVAYLQKLYPESWMERLADYLDEIFPEYAETMLALYENMQHYNQWFQSERQNLMSMTAEERRTLIWEMRRSFFGEAVDEIWEEALKNERVSDALIDINKKAGELSFTEQKTVYLDALSEVYGEELPDLLDARQQEVTDRFISMPAVQQNLQQMDVAQRRQSLTEMRRSLGMDEEAIHRWQALDVTRDERRAQGEYYKQEKEKLKSQLGVQEYELAVQALQNELFESEAEVIRNEEASGYFRFEEPQVYGMN